MGKEQLINLLPIIKHLITYHLESLFRLLVINLYCVGKIDFYYDEWAIK